MQIRTLEGVMNPNRIGVGFGWGGGAKSPYPLEVFKPMCGISAALRSLASLGSWLDSVAQVVALLCRLGKALHCESDCDSDCQSDCESERSPCRFGVVKQRRAVNSVDPHVAGSIHSPQGGLVFAHFHACCQDYYSYCIYYYSPELNSQTKL